MNSEFRMSKIEGEFELDKIGGKREIASAPQGMGRPEAVDVDALKSLVLGAALDSHGVYVDYVQYEKFFFVIS